MRRPSSCARPKVPAGQGSIWTRERSTIPRRSSAAFHSGCSCRAASTWIDSSICSGGRTSRTASQRSTSPRVTDTMASVTSATGPWSSTMRTRRSTSHLLAPVEGADQLLGRVAQAHVGEAERVVGHLGAAAGEDDLAGRRDLVARERGQGVQDRRGAAVGGHARSMLRGLRRGTLYHRPMDDAAERAARSARELARRIGVDHHDVLVVLGSGLSGVAELLGGEEDWVPLDTLPFFPPTPRPGTGRTAGRWSWRAPAPGAGRATPPVRGASSRPRRSTRCAPGIAAGCSTVILTAAVGGIRDDLAPGSVMVVEDQLNLTGAARCTGPSSSTWSTPTPRAAAPLALATPDPAAAAALAERPGVYAQLPGPQFETPAEIRMLESDGRRRRGHVDGARDDRRPRTAGVDVLGLAVVTNPAAAAEPPLSELAAIAAVGRRRRARRGRHRPARRRLAAVSQPGGARRRRPRRHQRARRARGHRVLHRDDGPGAEPHPAGLRVPRAWLDTANGQQVHLIEAEVPKNVGQHFALVFDDLDARRGRAAGARPAGERPGPGRDDGTPAGVHERPLGQRDRAAPRGRSADG